MARDIARPRHIRFPFAAARVLLRVRGLQQSAGMADTARSDESGLTIEQKRENVTTLAFEGDQRRYDAFVQAVREAIPPGTGVILRGSAVTGRRWKDGAPFDADGPGTSDLDLTLVGGDDVMSLFKTTGFFIPGVHSRPLSDEDPDIAPDLVPLRKRLMDMVKRPVNIQGSRDAVIYFRGELLGQPYLVLIEKPEPAEQEHES